MLAHPGLRPTDQEVPSGVHELEEEVEDDALNEVDDDVPHPVTNSEEAATIVRKDNNDTLFR